MFSFVAALMLIFCFIITASSQKSKQTRLSESMRLNSDAGLLGQSTMNMTFPDTIQVMRLQDFPNAGIALHFSCPESNMFATNCACHLRCKDVRACSDAVQLCEKYKSSHGCRYVLLRGGATNTIATLKRIPTKEETRMLDLSNYPSSRKQLHLSEHWTEVITNSKRRRASRGPLVGELIQSAGNEGQQLMNALINYNEQSYSNKPHCPGKDESSGASVGGSSGKNQTWKNSFLSSSISLVALSYQSPRTLLNSMRSWNDSGLLDMVSERIAILNDPFPQDLAIAASHRFRTVEPNEIPGVMLSKPNTLTIGAAFYYALKEASSKYVLFLENDFKIDSSLPKREILLELVAAIGMLDRGAELVRLLSRKHQGCGTFKSCDHSGINLRTDNMLDRRRNWFAFYCPSDTQVHTGLDKHMSTCLTGPEFRCFTSWDSNWSLNAILVKRDAMLTKQYPSDSGAGGRAKLSYKSIAEIGLEQYSANDGFESTMSWGVKWMRWRVPMCISYNGLFLHEEIETGA